jgi:hypothetical protein
MKYTIIKEIITKGDTRYQETHRDVEEKIRKRKPRDQKNSKKEGNEDIFSCFEPSITEEDLLALNSVRISNIFPGTAAEEL